MSGPEAITLTNTEWIISKKTKLETIFYSTTQDKLYPGFSEEVYQTEIVSGDLGDVTLLIEDPENNEIVKMSDELIPCDSWTILSDEFTLSKDNPTITLDTFTIEADDESFIDDEPVTVKINKIAVDCTGFYERNKEHPDLLTQDDFNVAQELYNSGDIDETFYNKVRYLFENQVECVDNTDCEGLLCTIGNPNCIHTCNENTCVIDDSATGNLAQIKSQIEAETINIEDGLQYEIVRIMSDGIRYSTFFTIPASASQMSIDLTSNQMALTFYTKIGESLMDVGDNSYIVDNTNIEKIYLLKIK